MGRVADCAIDKKQIWFHPHAIFFLEMCFKNESLEIGIWSTNLKLNTSRVLKKLVSDISQNQLVFVWTASDCKPQKGNKAAENPTKVIHTKSLKKVWDTYSQYDVTNTVIVDCSYERVKENPTENVILATPFVGNNQGDKWLIDELWRMLNKFNKETDVRDTLKAFR